MSERKNIYEAPEADLQPDNGDGPEFFRVGTKKLAIMLIFTIGFYLLYWYYRQWSLYRKYHCANMWPVARALFYIFFIVSLFRRIDEAARRHGETPPAWSYKPQAWLYPDRPRALSDTHHHRPHIGLKRRD